MPVTVTGFNKVPQTGEKFSFTPRIITYSIILTILVAFLVTLLFMRNDVEANILRLPGQMYSTRGDTISNVYTYKLLNKTNDEYNNVKIELIDTKGRINVIGGTVKIPKQGFAEGTLFINIHKKDLHSSKEKIKIGVKLGDELIDMKKTNFPSPLRIK